MASGGVPLPTWTKAASFASELLPLSGQGPSRQLNFSASFTHRTSACNSRSTSPNNVQICQICSAEATGRHYGTISCDGCKGFFRRSVRKRHHYICRHENNCTINKQKRNECRACRYMKCIRAGMKANSVQNERDRISIRSSRQFEHGDFLLNALLKAERNAREYAIYLQQHDATLSPPSSNILPPRTLIATVEATAESIKQQLRAIIQWAKEIPHFLSFPQNDQVALIKGVSAEILVLGVAFRSIEENDMLILGNDYILPRKSEVPEMAEIANRILDELVVPLKNLRPNEGEFVCLKAIIFFDPVVKNLQNPNAYKVHSMRRDVMVAMQDNIEENIENIIEQRTRFGEMLLLLPTVNNIASHMVQNIKLLEILGIVVDGLIQDLLYSTDVNANPVEPSAGVVVKPESIEDTQPQNVNFPHAAGSGCASPATAPLLSAVSPLLHADTSSVSSPYSVANLNPVSPADPIAVSISSLSVSDPDRYQLPLSVTGYPFQPPAPWHYSSFLNTTRF